MIENNCNNYRREEKMEDNEKEVSIVVHVNEYGEVVEVFNYDTKQALTAEDYDEKETKRMDKDRTLLYTPNGCCWRNVSGRWMCREEYCR